MPHGKSLAFFNIFCHHERLFAATAAAVPRASFDESKCIELNFLRVMIFNDIILPFAIKKSRERTRRVINGFPSQCHTAFTAEERNLLILKSLSSAKWLTLGEKGWNMFYFLGD